MEGPHLNLVSTNRRQLAVWDWPGEDPPLLFAHATGFHGRCWDHIIRDFPGRRAIAIDARGHGRSSKAEPPCLWREFGCDLAAIAGHMNLRNAIGIGHSMGGHVIVQAAALRPETYAALLLVDGNPLQDISATERISLVVFEGERIHRAGLFDQK